MCGRRWKARVLSQVGLVKYDILGVTALSQLQEMEQLTGVKPGEPWESEASDVFCRKYFGLDRQQAFFNFLVHKELSN